MIDIDILIKDIIGDGSQLVIKFLSGGKADKPTFIVCDRKEIWSHGEGKTFKDALINFMVKNLLDGSVPLIDFGFHTGEIRWENLVTLEKEKIKCLNGTL